MSGIQQFAKAAALDGALKLDGAGPKAQPKAIGTGFFGRAVVWLQGRSDGGKAENRAVMQSFVSALKTEFGESFALSAAKRLNVDSGKPLTSRTVRAMIQEGQQAKALAQGLNRAQGLRFSENTAPHDPHSFGKVFADVAADKGFTHPLGDLNLGTLQHAISRKIDMASNGGRKIVSTEQAKEIAEKEITKFIANKQALLAKIDTMGVSGAEKEQLVKFALTHDIRSPLTLEKTWSLRENVKALATVLGNPEASRGDRIQALATYQKAYDGAVAALVEGADPEEFGADDLVDLAANAIEVGFEAAGLDRETQTRLYAELTSASTGELRDAMGFIFQNTEEVGTGAETATKLRTMNDTLGAAIEALGRQLGMDPAKVTSDATPPSKFESVDAIPRDIIDGLHAGGLRDVEHTLDRRIGELPAGAGKKTLGDALLNLDFTRDVHLQTPTTPEGRRTHFEQARAQTDVLLHHRAQVAALGPGDAPPALKAALLAKLDQSIALSLEPMAERAAKSGASNKEMVAHLKETQGQIRAFIAQGPSEPLRKAAQDLDIGIQSEIYTRNDPGYISLDEEGDTEACAQMITVRRETGKLLDGDLAEVFARTPDPTAVAAVRERTAVARTAMAGLTAGGRLDSEAGRAGRAKIDAMRMGSSETIQGKSGGGEVEGGADRATANWREAAARASEIGRGGRLITLGQIKELNAILNRGMPGNDGVPGEFRTRPETAGRGPQYPTPEYVERQMNEFVEWLNENADRLDPIELAGLAYQKLVSIHPFADANGRTCRLVVDSLLEARGLPPASYQGKDEVNVAVFGVPQRGDVNITPDEAMRRVATAVERSVATLQEAVA